MWLCCTLILEENDILCVIALCKFFTCVIASFVLNTQIFYLVHLLHIMSFTDTVVPNWDMAWFKALKAFMPCRDAFSRHIRIALQDHAFIFLLSCPCTFHFCKVFFPHWHTIVKQQLIYIGSSSEVRNKGILQHRSWWIGTTCFSSHQPANS